MTDRIPFARKAGSGLAKMLRGLFGRGNLRKARDSVEALRSEFREGRAEAEDEPPRTVPHRVVEGPRTKGESGTSRDRTPSPGPFQRGP